MINYKGNTIDEKQSLISIIMATYYGDDSEELKEAVESILKQSYTNFELILSVDGPVPEERKLFLQEIEKSDRRIKILWNEVNRGPGAARNSAIKVANGDYIAIFDADDVAYPDKLENQLNYLLQMSLDIVGSTYTEFGTDINKPMETRTVPINQFEIKKKIGYFSPVANPTVIAKRFVFKENLYYESFRVGEDYALWIVLLKKGVKIGNYPYPTIYYRRGDSFLDRRRGLKYAKTDFLNKMAAASLYPFYEKPKIWFLAFASFIVRLLPAKLFNCVRNLRHRNKNKRL